MEEKQHGRRKRGLLWVFLFIIGAAAVVMAMNFLGIPVGNTFQTLGKKIPVIGSFIPDPASTQAQEGNNQDSWKQKYTDLSAQVKQDNQRIVNLTKSLSDSQKTVQDLKQNSLLLQSQQQQKQTKAAQDQLKQVAGIYGSMQPSKAAAMIQALPLEQAALTMAMIQPDQQSSIFSSMKDAKKAAQITMILKDISGINDLDPVALKNQIHQIAQTEQDPSSALSDTLAAMPPAQSAGIIQTMMGTNPSTAISLLKNMSTSSSSQILAQIQQNNTKLAALITANLNN